MREVPETKLRYAFAPVPKWVITEWVAGRMSDEALRLHVVLYGRAISDRLVRRQPTPKLLRTTLTELLRRPDNDALVKLIQRERKRGRLDYVVEGNPVVGYSYSFTLYPDGPKLSDIGPTSDASASTTSHGSEHGTESAIPTSPIADLSDLNAAAESASGPTNGSSCPTSDHGREPLAERDAADANEQARPTSRDVRERANPGSKENLDGEASRNYDQAIEKTTPSESADVSLADDVPRSDFCAAPVETNEEDDGGAVVNEQSNGRGKTETGLTVPLFQMPGQPPEERR